MIYQVWTDNDLLYWGSPSQGSYATGSVITWEEALSADNDLNYNVWSFGSFRLIVMYHA